jgi:hypothetical protein
MSDEDHECLVEQMKENLTVQPITRRQALQYEIGSSLAFEFMRWQWLRDLFCKWLFRVVVRKHARYLAYREETAEYVEGIADVQERTP